MRTRATAAVWQVARCGAARGGERGAGAGAEPIDDLWEGVDRLLARLDPETVSEHGLGALAARRLRLLGEELPERLLREERAARVGSLVAPALIARAREAYDGRLLLVKGPELVRHYPDGARGFGDLDLVAEDAERAQEMLLAAGFRLQPGTPPVDYERHHHLHPLVWPGLALPIEIHRRVMWPESLRGPTNEELFGAAAPADGGLLVPEQRHHALLLAAHAWGEVPMRKLRQLVDIQVFAGLSDAGELEQMAARWGFERGWRATLAAGDWLIRGGDEPGFVPIWGRYLRQLRDPTVVEMHIQEWLSPFTLAPPLRALRLSAAAVGRDLRPLPHETWGDKRRKIVRAVFHPLSPKSAYDRRFGVRPARGETAAPRSSRPTAE